MRHECAVDRLPLRYGEWVVQMIRGASHMGYITPAFGDVMQEWHRNCFNLLPFRGQSVLKAPYRCGRCFERIEHGDEVICFVVGRETGCRYSVCERRGYKVYGLRHVRCAIAEAA